MRNKKKKPERRGSAVSFYHSKLIPMLAWLGIKIKTWGQVFLGTVAAGVAAIVAKKTVAILAAWLLP